MRTKTRLLLPAGVLAAALIGTACGPPPPRRQPPTPTPPTTRRSARPCRPRRRRLPTPRTGPQRPGASTGRREATAVIGNRVYVGGDVQQRRVPDRCSPLARDKLAAFCLADGNAGHELRRPTSAPPRSLGEHAGHRRHEPVRRRQLPRTARPRTAWSSSTPAPAPGDTSFALIRFRPPGPPRRTAGRARHALLRAPASSTPAGDFGKIGAAGGPTSRLVGNAAGFNRPRVRWTGWFAVGPTRRWSRSPSALTTPAVYIGGNFTEVQEAQPADRRSSS